jgi:GTP-binding protein
MRARIESVDMVFDLFVELKATDEQLDFPIIYASAKNGFAMREVHENNEDMTPLFQAIVQHVPPPKISSEPFFQMLVSQPRLQRLPRENRARAYCERSCCGWRLDRLHSARWQARTRHRDSPFTYEGLEQVEIKHAAAGEIVGLAGFEEVYIGETSQIAKNGCRSSSWISIRRRFACTFLLTTRHLPAARENT